MWWAVFFVFHRCTYQQHTMLSKGGGNTAQRPSKKQKHLPTRDAMPGLRILLQWSDTPHTALNTEKHPDLTLKCLMCQPIKFSTRHYTYVIFAWMHRTSVRFHVIKQSYLTIQLLKQLDVTSLITKPLWLVHVVITKQGQNSAKKYASRHPLVLLLLSFPSHLKIILPAHWKRFTFLLTFG